VTHDEIQALPKNQTVTYASIVVDFCSQKSDPHPIRITAGGNLINYPGELSTRTADLTTLKLMWNSVLSTAGAKYMWIMKQYELIKHVLNGFIYLKMRRAMWGLPQAGILANKLL
jgi:hypothetical protein